MSSDSEQALAKYVEKMYQIQFSQPENILNSSQLKQIALEMGISEEEWEASQQVFEGHLENGKELILQQNWSDAIRSLDDAVSLNPYQVDALYYKAQAHVERFEEKQSTEDETLARELIARALQVQPGHKAALKLLSKLRKEKNEASEAHKNRKLYLGVGFAIVLGLLSFWGIMARNAAVKQEETVKQAWAQVENVYQRRADLIPKLVQTVKSAAKHETKLIEQLAEIHKNVLVNRPTTLSEQELAVFQQKQDELSAVLAVLFAKASQYTELGSQQAFSDLQVQIEGSENRISVERRKYNMAVQVYNSYVRQFPQNILGFSQKGYFKADKKAMENPKMDL